ncbi:MAG: OmpA family protein [Clostridium sp.]
MEEAKTEVDEYLDKEGLSAKVESNIDERGLVISLQDTLIFDSGSAGIKPVQREMISKIGKILKDMPNYIRIEGHTDNIPIKNSEFSSNWRLSSVRASNIVEVLIAESKITPTKISALGYGENRPVASNSTVDGQSKNRRVDIVILNSKYNETEQNSGPKVDAKIGK